jgi:hypothetical protein
VAPTPSPALSQPSTPPTTYSDALVRNLCSYIISGTRLVCLPETSLSPLSFMKPVVVLRACRAVVRAVRVVLLCVRRWCRAELRASGVVQVSHVHARRRQPGLLPGMRQRLVFWTTQIFSFYITLLLIFLTFLWFCA